MKKRWGFSLIELLMTIILLGIISVVVGKVLLANYQIFFTSQNITNADWQVWLGLERMANDIHNIRSSSDITTISATAFTFTNNSGTSVQYQLSGGNLLRNSQVLASGISGATFSYLTSSGATTATASAVHYISLSLTAIQGNMSVTMATLVGTRELI